MSEPDDPTRDWDPPPRPRKPDVVPSNDVYVTPTPPASPGRSSSSMPEFRSHEGVRLREIVAELFDLPESRVELAAPIDDDARYDFVLVPPRLESPDTMTALMRDGVAKHFGLQFDREVRSTDVFVMTAPNGVSGIREDGGGLGAFSMDLQVPTGFEELSADEQRAFFEHHLRQGMKGVDVRSRDRAAPPAFISASGDCNTKQLCRTLEGILDRLVVDETGAGAGDGFELNVSTENGVDGFLVALQQQLGIVVTPARRDVEVLVVRSR
jgi:uncharacterized protein (TIGR03435 family)